jgi:hypothetical protein
MASRLVLAVLLVGSVLLVNIIIVLFHVSTLTSANPQVYLKHQIRSLPNGDPDKPSSDWLGELYLALSDEVLLTRNIKSKEHLWKGIEQSPHFNQETGQILVFLGWVAYWVRWTLLQS